MDFNGNVRVEQLDRSEESRLDALNGSEKIQQIEIEDKRDSEIVQGRSKNSMKSVASPNFPTVDQYQKEDLQDENYRKMSEHSGEQSYLEYFSDETSNHFIGRNNWEHNIDDNHYDDYARGNHLNKFEGSQSNVPYRNSKSGMNISVVSHGESKAESIEDEKQLHSVSFKCSNDKENPKCDNRRRQFFPTSSNGCKKLKIQEPNKNEKILSIQEVSVDGMSTQPNYRCTFENCCGNCKSYILEIPNNDCNIYKNWQTNDFNTTNTCFEDCYCPHETNCDFVLENCHTPSKPCLQRVHFANVGNRPKNIHSACSFCSRKCTPSKASLFVEIGESVANVCNLNSGQAFEFTESVESLKDCPAKIECWAVKRNRSDLFRGKSWKRSDPRCKSSCAGRSSVVARSHSDRIANVDPEIDDTMNRDMCDGETLRCTRSNVSLQETRTHRTEQESNGDSNKETTDWSKECNSEERSLWGDIKKGKIWTQLQDTYKNFVRATSTGIGQIVKQSKFKRSKKQTKDYLTCGTSTKECEKSVWSADKCLESNTCNECLYMEACWNEIISQEPNNCDIRCCRNTCCEMKPMCRSDYWKHNCSSQDQIPSKTNGSFDPCNNFHENVQPPCSEPHTGHHCPNCSTVRNRGGADPSNQRKKTSNSNKRPSLNAGTCNNANNQAVRKQNQCATTSNQQGQHATHMDVSVQANAVRPVADPSNAPYFSESMAFRRRIRAVQNCGSLVNGLDETSYLDFPPPGRDGIVVQDVGSMLHSLPSALAVRRRSCQSRRSAAQATGAIPKCGPSSMMPRNGRQETAGRVAGPRRENVQRPVAKQDRPVASEPTADRRLQCKVIQAFKIVCGPMDTTDDTDQIEPVCLCTSSMAIPTIREPRGDAARSAARIPEGPAAGRSEVPTIEDVTGRVAEDHDTAEPSAQQEPIVEHVAEEQAAVEDATVEQPAVEDDTVDQPAVEDDIVEQPAVEHDTVEQAAVESLQVQSETAGVQETVSTESAPPAQTDQALIAEQTRTSEAPEAEYTEIVEDPDVIVMRGDPPGRTEPAADVSLPDYEATIADAEATMYPVSQEPTVVEPETALSPMPRAQVEPVDPRAPVEVSKEMDGKRTHVSVEMQTSSTILTKIISEFQVGNRKGRVLMSIKLQTNMDDVPQGQQPPGPNNDDNMNDDGQQDDPRRSRRPGPQRGGPQRSRRQRNQGRTRPAEDGSSNNELDDAPTDSSRDSCIGRCGRRKR